MHSWSEILVGLLIVALVAVLVFAAVYDAKHCLKHERGPGMTCTTMPMGTNNSYTTCSPEERCVEWDNQR